MTWSVVRLELARTHDHPEGSTEHVYELVVPLAPDGLIDRAAFDSFPARATVQRLEHSGPVQRGAVLRNGPNYVLSYKPGESDDEIVAHLGSHPLVAGNYVTVSESGGGERLPYRVTWVRPLPPITA